MDKWVGLEYKNKKLFRYEISNKGEIRNLKTNKISRIYKNPCGYYYVYLCDSDNKRAWAEDTPYLIHKMMCYSFFDNYDTMINVCDHIDRNKRNNELENLRIISQRENCGNKKNNSLYGVGVKLNKSGTFSSSININKKNVILGTFSTPEEASSKYNFILQQLKDIEKSSRKYDYNRTKINNEYFLEFFPITIV